MEKFRNLKAGSIWRACQDFWYHCDLNQRNVFIFFLRGELPSNVLSTLLTNHAVVAMWLVQCS